MAMDKDAQNAIYGAAGAAVTQGFIQKYGDKFVAPMVYSPTQYAVDLKKYGYVYQTTPVSSDEEVGALIISATGYKFASVTAPAAANLTGTNKRTATIDTYMAAVGQKVAPYMLPSVWGSGVIGLVAALDAVTDKSFLLGDKRSKQTRILEASVGGGLVGAAVLRAIPGLTGVKIYPSGFDAVATPTMQYLDKSAMHNLQILSADNNRLGADNNRLQQELAQLRSAKISTAQYPRGMPPGIPSYSAQVNAQQPVVQVSEILPQKGAEAIKERTYMMGGAIQKATAEAVRNQTGLVTLTGGR